MCVDVSKDTMHSLIDLLLDHKKVLFKLLKQQRQGSSPGVGPGTSSLDADELDFSVVLSAVNVLTSQVYQLLSGASLSTVRKRGRAKGDSEGKEE